MNESANKTNKATTMWIGVGTVFVLMTMAWVAMFFFASKHRAADVPLEKTEERR